MVLGSRSTVIVVRCQVQSRFTVIFSMRPPRFEGLIAFVGQLSHHAEQGFVQR
jgi:hypothetical protein